MKTGKQRERDTGRKGDRQGDGIQTGKRETGRYEDREKCDMETRDVMRDR